MGLSCMPRDRIARRSGNLLYAFHLHVISDVGLQHAFENLEADAKDGIVDELLGHGAAVFADVAKNQWGAYCIQHSKSISFTCPPFAFCCHSCTD